MAHSRATSLREEIVAAVEECWSGMSDQQPRLLRSWIDEDHLIFVYKPAPETDPALIYGLDYSLDFSEPSPTGCTDLPDTALAEEIARFMILEPRGVNAPREVVPGRIYWWPERENRVWRPESLNQL